MLHDLKPILTYDKILQVSDSVGYESTVFSVSRSVNTEVSSGISNNSLNFNLSNTISEAFFSLSPYLEITFSFDLVGTSTTPPPATLFPSQTQYIFSPWANTFAGGDIAIRCKALSSIMSLCRFTLNQSAIDCDPHFFHPLMCRYNNLPYENFNINGDGSYPDQGDYVICDGSFVKDPLANDFTANDSFAYGEASRGSYIRFTTLTTTQASGYFTLRAGLPMSLFESKYINEKSLRYITQANLQINFISDLTRVLSIRGSKVNLTSKTVNITNAKLVYDTFLAPQGLKSSANLNHNYSRINQQSRQLAAPVPANGLVNVQSNVLSLSTVPKLIFFWVELSEQQKDCFSADISYFLESLSVLVNGTIALQLESGFDVWRTARSNGLNDSYICCEKNVGTMFCAQFGKDIPLSAYVCPSTLTNGLSVQINAVARNISTFSSTPNIKLIYIDTGIYEQVLNTSRLSTSVLTIQDNKNAIEDQSENMGQMVMATEIEGGNWYGSGARIGGRIEGTDWKKTGKILKNIFYNPATKAIGTAAMKIFGLGEGEMEDGEMEGSGRRRRSKKTSLKVRRKSRSRSRSRRNKGKTYSGRGLVNDGSLRSNVSFYE